MTYRDIIDNVPSFPIVRKKGTDFRICLFKVLDFYEKKLNELDNNIEIKNEVRKLSAGIKKTINAYYEGNQCKAYKILSSTLNETDLGLNEDAVIPDNSNLYRIRIKDSNYPVSRDEIFHIPFNLRELVATQRYSVPGLPSLYIANSIYVAWEELGRPSGNLIQAARFRNNRDLFLLDLTSDGYYRKRNLISDGSISEFNMKIWPLIAACSVKVPNRDVAFKPEYIIPQLLLPWVIKNEFDGIKYSSTHINQSKNNHIGKLYNIVLPVRTFKQNYGYCKELLDIFEVSNVMPMQLNQFSIDNSNEVVGHSELNEIELIKGKRVRYSETMFGKVENQLKSLPVKKIPAAKN